MTSREGWIGIDVDGCRDPKTGKLDQRARRIVAIARSYTEKSPSGTGIKVIARGRLPKGRHKRRDKTVELYERQYFTITGQRVPRTPREPQRRTRAFARIQREFIVTEPEPRRSTGARGGTRPWIAKPPGKPSPRLSDADVLRIAGAAKNGEKFKRLWRGDFAGLYGSQSEADFALVAMLRFYTQDAEQLDRLFRQSKLYRPTGKSRSYVATMIRKAIEGGGETFQPTKIVTMSRWTGGLSWVRRVLFPKRST